MASGGSQAGDGNEDLAGNAEGSRLVATIRRPGSVPTRVWASAAASSMTCSQLSRTTTSERPARWRAMSSAVDPEGWSSPGAGPEAPERTQPQPGRRLSGSVTPASSTSQAPPGVLVAKPSRGLDRQAGLADSAGADQRD